MMKKSQTRVGAEATMPKVHDRLLERQFELDYPKFYDYDDELYFYDDDFYDSDIRAIENLSGKRYERHGSTSDNKLGYDAEMKAKVERDSTKIRKIELRNNREAKINSRI